LALGGRRLVGKPNNQPKVGGSVWGDVIEEARWAWSAGGDVIASFRVSNQTMKKQNNKIHRGLKWLPIEKKTHNNQPKTGGRDGGDHLGEARRAGGAGKRDIIVFGGGEV